MSPSRIDEQSGFLQDMPVNKAIFPDGYKTSGQHEPIYSLVKPYEKFPKEITGPTVWMASDFKNNPEKWTYTFTEDDIAEIEAAADRFLEEARPLTGITKVRSYIPPMTCLSVKRGEHFHSSKQIRNTSHSRR